MVRRCAAAESPLAGDGEPTVQRGVVAAIQHQPTQLLHHADEVRVAADVIVQTGATPAWSAARHVGGFMKCLVQMVAQDGLGIVGREVRRAPPASRQRRPGQERRDRNSSRRTAPIHIGSRDHRSLQTFCRSFTISPRSLFTLPSSSCRSFTFGLYGRSPLVVPFGPTLALLGFQIVFATERKDRTRQRQEAAQVGGVTPIRSLHQRRIFLPDSVSQK